MEETVTVIEIDEETYEEVKKKMKMIMIVLTMKVLVMKVLIMIVLFVLLREKCKSDQNCEAADPVILALNVFDLF